jgi:hypothetical protein
LQAYAESTEQLQGLEASGLSGSLYFEIFDVEIEQQGFLTYDRALAKVPVAEIARLNGRLVPRAANYAAATRGFSVATVDWTPESQRYASLVADFRKGRRDPSFLRRLALMALRQNDQTQATTAGDAFIAASPEPYTRETWEAIVAVTRTRADQGFALLRSRSAEANAVMGPQAAEKKVLEILQREVIAPYFNDRARKQSWQEFEIAIAAEYGALGREAVLGAHMMELLLQEDWNGFGTFYARYYATATPRSLYLLHNLSHQVLRHVSEPQVLESAIRAMAWQLDWPREDPVFGRYDPVELDTYANLLDKAGRTSQALEWQEQAVALSHGRDPEIVENLTRMKDALTTRLGARAAAPVEHER